MNLKRKINKYKFYADTSSESIRLLKEEIKGLTRTRNQLAIKRLESDIKNTENYRDQSLAKKAELEEELENLIKAEERADEFPSVVRPQINRKGGKKSKKRKSTRKSRKTNKRRAKK